jgi:serine/threonine protein kinase
VNWNDVVGEGAYGSVHICTRISDGGLFALKKMSRKHTTDTSFKRETDALLLIYDEGGHANISGLRDMYSDADHYFLVLDLATGDEMFDHLVTKGVWSECEAVVLLREIAAALSFLHDIGIVHADLKPENFVLESAGSCTANGTTNVKLVDFGCATIMAKGYPEAQPLSKRPVSGTTAYWPPECFHEQTKHDRTRPAVDMWSLGVILYIMLTGVHPFDLEGVATDDEIELQILRDPKPNFSIPSAKRLSDNAKDLIMSLMEADASKRISARDILEHPFVNEDNCFGRK